MFLATIATLVALPAIWLFSQGGPSRGTGASGAQAVGLPTPAGENRASSDTADDPFGTNGPIFIDGPTTPPRHSVIQIVVPAVNRSAFLEGGASFKNAVGLTINTCSAPAVPFGASITVTNRDNGHVVTCINNAPAPVPPSVVIVLSAEQYAQIGALIDAPLPVRITW
ncbi:unannotated protein [freshwater metagenome]|uniref:Unannotated protein n=1 Tax=freshwater metagenome TaxID=449393 RepID=A0A6J7DCI8_9ZZZZ|nr:hypothetical protein [Actinomycetota bacterium]